MCGIVGFCNLKHDISGNAKILSNMNSRLSKRGPDEDGFYISNNACMAHKRLIVIDPDGGKQPMSCTYSNNMYTIVYNGQIYNTKELRKTLVENGFDFSGHCDTEVLLKSYIFYGKDVVKHLNGIFAFAIWDKSKNELFVARDHFGVKPLFYSIVNDTFIFASEIKALLEFPNIHPEIDSTRYL